MFIGCPLTLNHRVGGSSPSPPTYIVSPRHAGKRYLVKCLVKFETSYQADKSNVEATGIFRFDLPFARM